MLRLAQPPTPCHLASLKSPFSTCGKRARHNNGMMPPPYRHSMSVTEMWGLRSLSSVTEKLNYFHHPGCGCHLRTSSQPLLWIVQSHRGKTSSAKGFEKAQVTTILRTRIEVVKIPNLSWSKKQMCNTWSLNIELLQRKLRAEISVQ